MEKYSLTPWTCNWERDSGRNCYKPPAHVPVGSEGGGVGNPPPATPQGYGSRSPLSRLCCAGVPGNCESAGTLWELEVTLAKQNQKKRNQESPCLTPQD